MKAAVSRIGIALSALDGRPYVELLNAAILAEECGYEIVLVPEAWGRDATVVLGALAARTTRIGIGTGIVNVYSRSPALIAMAAATLDEISGGRAVLGLATPESLAADLALISDGLRGAARARAEFTVAPIILALVTDDPSEAALVKRNVAHYIGGMGRFYAEALARHGHVDAVRRIKELWAAGQRDAAADAVPDDLLGALALCGPAERCRA